MIAPSVLLSVAKLVINLLLELCFRCANAVETGVPVSIVSVCGFRSRLCAIMDYGSLQLDGYP